MAAIEPNPTSLPLALTRGRPATRATVVIPLPAARPWLHHILPVRWRCYGQPFQASSTRSRQVATPWITPLSVSIRLIALLEGRHRQTTSTAGAALISRQL